MQTRKLILHQSQSPGDVLCFSRSVGDLKLTKSDYLIDIRTNCDELFLNSPRITKLSDDDPDVERYEIGYSTKPGIHESGWTGAHFSDAFRVDLESKLNSDPEKIAIYGEVKIIKTGIRPEIFVSDQEKSWFNQVHDTFGIDDPYWVINAGHKSDLPLKQYHRWQEVADLFNERFKGRIHLVQTGEANPEHFHASLKGVLNLIGKTDKRQFIRLVYNAHGTVGGMSYQHHLSGAFNQPHVTVLGGREGSRWEYYQCGTLLYTNGMLRCCKWDGCWLSGKIEKDGKDGRCKDLVDYEGQQVPRCMSLITPEEIVNSIEKYYLGGELKMPEAQHTDIPKPVAVETPVETEKELPIMQHTPLSKDKKVIDYLNDLKEGSRVLLIFPHGLGDITLFYPVVLKLREHYPDIVIDMKFGQGYNKVFGGEHDINEKNYDFIFDIAYWCSEGTGIMKVETCCKGEIGIECDDSIKLLPNYLPSYPNPIVAVHFNSTCNPPIGCSYEVAKLIWDEIIATGLIPLEVNYEHWRHNALNKKFDFVTSSFRGCTPDVQNLVGIIQNSFAFLGVCSGPVCIALSCIPERTLYLENIGVFKLEEYCLNPIAKKIPINPKEYIRGSVSNFLTDLIEKANYKKVAI